jgi:hypothetical protein
MTMNRVRLRNSLIIALVGFLIGWVVTRPIFVAWKDAEKIRTAGSSQTSPADTTGQNDNYVVVWIDDWNKELPSIDAVWIACMPPNYTSVTLIGLPPGPFRGAYSRGAQAFPPVILQPYLKGPLRGTVTFDRNDIRVLVDDLGGIYLDGQLVSGAQVEEYLAKLDSDGQDVLIRQAAVIQGLLAQVATGGTDIRLADLIDIPKSSAERAALIDTVNHYYPLHLETVSFSTAAP